MICGQSHGVGVICGQSHGVGVVCGQSHGVGVVSSSVTGLIASVAVDVGALMLQVLWAVLSVKVRLS